MARADSTVRVNIIGDAKSLSKATTQAEGSFKGVNKTALKVGGVIAGAFAADAIFGFADAANQEFDRVQDAAGRLEDQLGGPLAAQLQETADDFTAIGASKGDMLELEARFADIATAAGIADDEMAPFAEDAAEAASAIALITDKDPSEILDNIAKAAAGGKKPLKELGVFVDEAAVAQQALADTGKTSTDQLTDGELAAARYKIIMEQLAPKVEGVKDSEADLETQQARTQAKMENLQAAIGEKLNPVLADMLDFVLTGITGWEMLGVWIDDNRAKIAEWLTPAARLVDLLGAIVTLFQELNKLNPAALLNPSTTPGAFGNGFRPSGASGPGGQRNSGFITVQVNGGSPEAIEQAVRKAVATAARHGS